MSALIDPVDPDLYYVPKARPVLKWVGGKAQLQDVILKEIDRLHPAPIEQYYEPFAGGLAIFFALRAKGKIKKAVLSDTNEELINFYLQIQNEPEALIAALRKLRSQTGGEKHYYAVRSQKLKNPAARAARFKYINARGYNGLWRVNKKNLCNVPWGRHKRPPEILKEEAIWAAHHAFDGAEIKVAAFSAICRDIMEVRRPADRLVYLDPPYWPTRTTASFTSYSAEGFGPADHDALECWMDFFAEYKIPALLSNSDVPDVHQIFKDYKRKKVSARRNVNSVGTGRGAVSELLIESTWKKKK